MNRPEIKITDWNRQTIGFAVSALGEALSSNPNQDGYRFLLDAKKARRYIDEMLGEVYPLPKLSEQEAHLSSSLHTYMRKCMDSKLSVILYRLISENRGLNTWYAFIKGVNASKKHSFLEGLYQANHVASEIGTTDELFMNSALHIWQEHEQGQDDLKMVLTEYMGQ